MSDAWPAFAQAGPQGITVPVALAPFNPDAAPCSTPSGLKRTLSFVQENDREFLEGVSSGLQAAARDRGLTYARVLANSDDTLASNEIQSFRAMKAGAIVATSS